MPAALIRPRRVSPPASPPRTPNRAVATFRPARLAATLAAPPSTVVRSTTLATGTGASGEMRSTSLQR